MQSVGRLGGALGVVLLCTTPLTWLITSELGLAFWGKLGVGLLGIGLYWLTHPNLWNKLLGARSSALWLTSALGVVAFVVLLGVLNYVAVRFDKEFDLTKEGLHTLTPHTQRILAGMGQEVNVYAFMRSTEADYEPLRRTLSRYASQSPNFTFEFVDPQARPDLTEKYNITEKGPRIVVASGNRDARAKHYTEHELTNAIITVAESLAQTIYFVKGHAEGNVEDAEHGTGYATAAEALRAQGYRVRTWSLLEAAKAAPKAQADLKSNKAHKTHHEDDDAGIPKEAAVVVLAGPQSVYFPAELKALEDFLAQGGRLLAMHEPRTDNGLDAFVKQWRIELRNDFVVDLNPLNQMTGLGPASPLAQPTPAIHPITQNMKAPAVLSTVRSLAVKDGGLQGVDVRPFLRTSSSAWGEIKIDAEVAQKDPEDFEGPLHVAIAATRHVPRTIGYRRSKEARVVVMGDSDWANNKHLRSQSNRDLWLNVMDWLAQHEERIAIRPPQRAGSTLSLTGRQVGMLTFLAMDAYPVLLIALGLWIVLKRRQS